MKGSIITIGDEILIGQIVDTNSVWIAQKLNELGVRVENRVSVGDQREAILEQVKRTLGWADITVITGGLGPTKDDITKHTLAELFGSKMYRNQEVFEMNRRRLVERGIEYNELNQGQATVPQACEVLLNRNGTAPGMWFEREGKVVIALPGVPFEMRALMEDEVLPRLRSRLKVSAITHHTISTVGLAESMLAQRIESWENALPEYLHLAYLPGTSGIRLRLSVYDMEREQAKREIDRRYEELRKILGEHYLGDEVNRVETVVADMLRERGERVAIAESCTGGAIAGRFTAIAGASDYLWGGVVSYSVEAKEALLGVESDVIQEFGVVSREVAVQMAERIRRIANADYAIATTGVAGPTAGTEKVPVGVVWIAIAHRGGTVTERKVFGKLREQNIEQATTYAINMLRLLMLERASGEE